MYSTKFKKRLVNDFKLPIKLLDEPYFSYLVNLYNEDFKIDEKIKTLQTSIDMVGGEANIQSEWYKVKDQIEAEVKAVPAYLDLNNYQSDYVLKTKVEGLNPYNNSMVDKTCVSIDIRTANYNALKVFDSELVFNTKDFQEFISKFTKVPLFHESKIFRQLLFEPLGAKKQAHIQRQITYQSADELMPLLSPKEIRSVSNDELVLVFDKTEDLASLQDQVEKALSQITHSSILKTEAFNVVNVHEKCFYKKTVSGFQLRNVSAQLYPQMFKRVKGLELTDLDLVFWDTNTEKLAKYLGPVVFDGKN